MILCSRPTAQLQTVKGEETDRRELLRAIAPMSILVLDESHNAGGTAKTQEVKGKAPDRADFVQRASAVKASGVVYSSATYAKNPHVMTLYSATDRDAPCSRKRRKSS